MSDPLTYEPTAGTSIEEAAQEMVALAREKRATVTARFNDIALSASAGATAASIADYYRTECALRAAAYRRSPEGKRAAAELEEKKRQAQATVDQLTVALPNLDFDDLDAVLCWLEELRGPSDWSGVIVPESVVSTFRAHRFEPNVNIGADFDGNDRENYARYLIGQALDNLISVGAIHHIIHHFAADWRDCFPQKEAPAP